MRRTRPPSEIGRLAAPVAGMFDAAWRRMHWWVGAMAVLYALSGITIVKSDEAAVVLRWGRLVGDTPALQQHGPGLLFALPRPIDQIVRVPIKHVWEVQVKTLASTNADAYSGSGMDPLTQGYALTGDQNIVHVDMVARYRIRNPADWAFYGPKADILRVEVAAAMVRSLGEMPVDRVLADGRKDLIATATHRAQAGLDAAHSGLELSSLELTRLAPPAALATDFDSVQSAFIGMETRKKEAQTYEASSIPEAQAKTAAAVQSAVAAADSDLATARGAAQAFLALEKEYRAQPGVVKERLYRDGVERAIGRANSVRWVPPPIGGNYHGFRITLQPGPPRPRAAADPDEGGDERE